MKIHQKILRNSLFLFLLLAPSVALSMNNNNVINTGNNDTNVFTDMVQALAQRVREIRDKSARIINPNQDLEAREQIVDEIKGLAEPLKAIEAFVHRAMADDPDFKNKLNDEGMPARIIEGEIELSFRYDLDAISRSLGLGTMEENDYISALDWKENDIYNVLENLEGPLMTFNDLDRRYNGYKRFLFEEREGKYAELDEQGNYKYKYGKRYTAQEAHVTLHIAAYVTSVEEAFALVQYDGGRHLCNLLKVYVNWLQTFATHTSHDIDVIKAHGSLLGIADKNDKTMRDWTNELKSRVNDSEISDLFRDEIKKQFDEIKRSLTLSLFQNPETGVIEKAKTRDPLKLGEKKLNAWGFEDVKQPMPSIVRDLDLETKRVGREIKWERSAWEIEDLARRELPHPGQENNIIMIEQKNEDELD